MLRYFFLIILLLCISIVDLFADDFETPVQIRFIRIFGEDNELNPPILLLQNQQSQVSSLGFNFITIEFDVVADVPPSIFAKFYHCSVDWKEDDNVFLNDIITSRTSIIDWRSAPITEAYYSYRGRIVVPNSQAKFEFAGNWKVKIFDYDNDTIPLAEARFFVVKPIARCNLRIYTDFYDPSFNFISPTSVTVEAFVYGDSKLFDSQQNTCVLYKNHRWYEPVYISRDAYLTELNMKKYCYQYYSMVGGFLSAGKLYRIAGIPAENEYRVLDLSNLAAYPNVSGIVSTLLPDLRRRGEFWDKDNDGAMSSYFIADYNDNYVNMEFRLRPDNWYTSDELYVVGSFNNWKPSAEWQMYYDENSGYYKLRHLLRRAKHDYMYATGKLNISTNEVEKISYDQYEGNATNHDNSYIIFVYYREFEYGGYDSIIAVSVGSFYGTFKRY